MEAFSQKLKTAVKRTGGCLCVGLDVDLAKLPKAQVKQIAEAYTGLIIPDNRAKALEEIVKAYIRRARFESGNTPCSFCNSTSDLRTASRASLRCSGEPTRSMPAGNANPAGSKPSDMNGQMNITPDAR